jgi:23S rRNA pseudoU1915 N3-methylase RlmH
MKQEETMSNPDVSDEWVQKVQDAVEDLLVELEERISKIFEYTLNNIEEELTASELSIQQIFKEKQKELFGKEFQEWDYAYLSTYVKAPASNKEREDD